MAFLLLYVLEGYPSHRVLRDCKARSKGAEGRRRFATLPQGACLPEAKEEANVGHAPPLCFHSPQIFLPTTLFLEKMIHAASRAHASRVVAMLVAVGAKIELHDFFLAAFQGSAQRCAMRYPHFAIPQKENY
ncbi:hypothetical protein HYW17_00850 [Candidatus Uhrbacteria bacterium]|nr:hypothetical protein [Candidatus Uhrbacteria bacterium]